jgi:hypothetical protein
VNSMEKPVNTGQDERRLDARIMVNIPVEIVTMYHKGDEIRERTHIEDFSDQGCRFTVKGAMCKGDTVAIHLLAHDGAALLDEPPRLVEIIWIARGESAVVVGARLLGGAKFDKTDPLQISADH